MTAWRRFCPISLDFPGSLPSFAVAAAQWAARLEGITLDIRSVFKIPRMVDYVVPSGVSISNTDRRLARRLSITRNHSNGGRILRLQCRHARPRHGGRRISAGVIVGEGTDIGGGASIMGTISGGGKQVITIGRHSLPGGEFRHRHLARRSLRYRSRMLCHRRRAGAPAIRRGGEGGSPFRPAEHPVPPQCADRNAGSHRT